MRATLAVALSLAACNRAAPPARRCLAPPAAEGAVLARVGDVAITDAQLLAYEGLGELRGNERSFAGLLAKVEDRVRFELLAQAAADRGLAADPEVIEVARKAMVRKLLADDMGAARLGAQIDEDVLQRHYAQHKGDYQQPAMRRFTVLQFGNDALGRAQAEAFVRQWRTGSDDARSLAAALQVRPPLGKDARRPRHRPRLALRWQEQPYQSEATTARIYGDEVARAVFAGPPWTMPALVETTRGPIAVRVLACRDAMVRSYAQARGDIVEQLVRRERTQLFGKYLDGLRQTYPIAIYEDALHAWLQRPPAAAAPRASDAVAAPTPTPVPAAPPVPTTAEATRP